MWLLVPWRTLTGRAACAAARALRARSDERAVRMSDDLDVATHHVAGERAHEVGLLGCLAQRHWDREAERIAAQGTVADLRGAERALDRPAQLLAFLAQVERDRAIPLRERGRDRPLSRGGAGDRRLGRRRAHRNETSVDEHL